MLPLDSMKTSIFNYCVVFFMNLISKKNKTVRFLITFEKCFKSAHHQLI